MAGRSTHAPVARTPLVERRIDAESTVRRELIAPTVVWGSMLIMVGAALAHVARYGRNIPLAEDWLLVPPMTGDQPDFWSWVWSQNNEHRLPIARLVYLGLLEATHDFRVGMVFNVVLLGAVAATFVLLARRLRGRTSVVDAFFPVVLLHLGHWNNLVWGWQMQFVIATALVLVLLAVFVADRGPPSVRTSLLAGGALVALPFAGGSALPMIPAGIAGFVALVLARPGASQRSRRIAFASAGLSVVFVGFYFLNYQDPSWYPDNPGPRQTVFTANRLLALGWGPAARSSWTLASLGMFAVVGSAATVLVLAVRRGGPERRRALALGCFLVGALLVILAVGYGRAALVPTEGLPDRYVLLAVPVLLSAWFAWELFGPARWRRGAQLGLLVAVVALVPLNTRSGYEWRDWYSAEMNAVECDIAAGRSRDELVERHGDFLMHWSPEQLSWSIDLLREERIGPFAEVRSDSGTGAADPTACAILDAPAG